MKLLYLDCGMGAAGDMLGAALAELLPDAERDAFIAEINDAGIPGVKVSLEPSVKCGITGTHLTVTVNGAEEEVHDHVHGHHGHDHSHEHSHGEHSDHGAHGHIHEHTHDHEHSHHAHRSLHDIHHIIANLKLPETVRQDILAVYKLIAEAESKAHDKPVSEIHFHEVGTMDAIADIASVCLLLHKLAPDQIIASPIHVGSGQVKCAHGILPVPAPATASILKDVPIYSGQIRGELCTPTGAALLKHFVTHFGEMPMMTPSATGYGMGKKDFPAANCVRIILGESFAADSAPESQPMGIGSSSETPRKPMHFEAAPSGNAGSPTNTAASDSESPGGIFADTICELSCNVDDMTGEDVAFAVETFLENGARDAFTIPCTMKKGRPGLLITVLCSEADREKVAQLMLRHTTTLGVRMTTKERRILARTEAECRIPDQVLRTAVAEADADPVTGNPAKNTPDKESDKILDIPAGSEAPAPDKIPNMADRPDDQAPAMTAANLTIRYKTSTGCGVTRTKFEHDDLAKIARTHGLTLEQVRALLRDLQ